MPLHAAGRGQRETNFVLCRCRQRDDQTRQLLTGELPGVAKPVFLARGQLAAARQPPQLHSAQRIERAGGRRGEHQLESPGGAVHYGSQARIERAGGRVAGTAARLDVVVRRIAGTAISDRNRYPEFRLPGKLRRPRRQAAVLDIDGPQVVGILRRNQRRGHRDDGHDRQRGEGQDRDPALRVLGRDPTQRRVRVAGGRGGCGRDGGQDVAHHLQCPSLRPVRIRGSITEYKISTIRLMLMNNMTITIR